MAVALMEHKNHTEGEPDVTITLMNGGTLENGPDKPDEHLDAEGQGVPKNQWQATPSLLDACPTGWIKKEDSCYFFSDVEKDWNISQTNCSSSGAFLLTLDSELEWALVKSRRDEFWIDLQREEADQPWKWRNGSDVTQFEVKGTGLCGYTNGDTVSSTTCDNTRHWICRKPVHVA